VTHYELASLGRGTRKQEGCELFSCVEEPTRIKGGEVVAREATNDNNNSSSDSNNNALVAPTDTGGKGSITQQVHGEF